MRGSRSFGFLAAVSVVAGVVVAVTVAAVPADALPSGCTQAAAADPVTCTYAYTGAVQGFTVPVGVFSLDVVAVGAVGGAGFHGKAGGAGASVEDTAVPVTAGQTLTVLVGGVGEDGTETVGGAGGTFGGGAAGDPVSAAAIDDGGGGGGYTGLFGPNAPLVVAAGGGGGGGFGESGGAGDTGSGGGNGGDRSSGRGGTGAHGAIPGTGGAGAIGAAPGTDGGPLQGGKGGDSNGGGHSSGGGGGGGYAGGGGGGGGNSGGGGGGGSSYGITELTNEATAAGPATVTITYLLATSVATQASGGVGLGGTISDTATLGEPDPQGTVTFSAYGPDDTTCGLTAAFTSTVSADGSASVTSGDFTPTQPGTYRWIASYDGDDASGPGTGACNDANESVTVAKAPTRTTITSDDPDPSVDGTSVTVDYSVASSYDGGSATGSVTVTDGAASCTVGVSVGSCALALSGAGVHDLTATYSGDATYAGSPSAPEPHTVIAKPSAPQNPTATAGNARATVAFDPPADDGDSTVTSYTVTATDTTNPAHGGQTASGSGSPLTVTALTNGDTYTFTVTATNDAGTGPASDPSNPVTPTAPTKAKADLSIAVSGPVKAADGASFTETITVTNAGPSPASFVSTYITVPTGLTVKSAPGSKKVGAERLWTTPTLAAHATHTYKITYKVAANTHRTVTLNAATGARTTDPTTTNNSTSRQVRLG